MGTAKEMANSSSPFINAPPGITVNVALAVDWKKTKKKKSKGKKLADQMMGVHASRLMRLHARHKDPVHSPLHHFRLFPFIPFTVSSSRRANSIMVGRGTHLSSERPNRVAATVASHDLPFRPSLPPPQHVVVGLNLACGIIAINQISASAPPESLARATSPQ